ncbi:aminoglycoside phosphotransferase family protein [Georgenia alba]|uniref:Aminoglycoside phosphotransferase family protein n=1 Tax=Georgenia alba TaxID=2233858 RepID=A0ABW2QCV4_9MICO
MSGPEITPALASQIGRTADGAAWLERLPGLVADARSRWGLSLGSPFTDGSAGWTAPGRTADGEDVVVKISFPHEEAVAEVDGLRIWSGRGGPELLDHHRESWSLLLRRVRPGHVLEADHELGQRRPEDRLEVASELLGRLHAAAPGSAELPELADYTARLAGLLRERAGRHAASLEADPGLLAEAAHLLEVLPAERAGTVVHGDFNPGNLLAEDRDGRRGWVAIDPKPMLGDPAYDPVPLIAQVADPFREEDVTGLLRARTAVVCGATGLDPARVAAWGLARMVESALWLAEEVADRDGALNQLREAREWSRLAV